MEPTKKSFNGKDFFLNLGAIIALYSTVISALRVIFVAIDSQYPKITNAYQYYSPSISWPVAVLMVSFPVFIILMWVIRNQYESEPETRNGGVHRLFTYLTLFITGVVLVGDLIAVLYYFIDGQELTTAFLLKFASLFVVMGSVFMYYLSDIRNKQTKKSRMIWRILALIMVAVTVIWGFSVLGSPRTQRLYKYDQQKINDLQNLNSQIQSYYVTNGKLPANLDALKETNFYGVSVDEQNGLPYEYSKTSDLSYNVCATFNKDSKQGQNNSIAYPIYGEGNWTHPTGRHCFTQKINTLMYPKTPMMVQ